jgi:pimeloyl-ACP methyl ester carboxylesterase
VPEVRIPPFIRLLTTPVGNIVVRIPEKPKMVRSQLRRLGHGASIDGSRIPDEFIPWHTAATRETGSMRHEREMVRAVASPRGFRPGLVLQHPELSTIRTPTLYVYGTADPVASVEIVERVVAALPQAELDLVQGAGHIAWLDDPATVGERLRRFLAQR